MLLQSRHQAYSAVNFAMAQAYWQIGRIIVEHEQAGKVRADYGKSVLQELSSRLTADFGKGFSVRTLQQMKKFYATFPNANALRSQLTWTPLSPFVVGGKRAGQAVVYGGGDCIRMVKPPAGTADCRAVL